jgi:hypothetical protein
MTKTASQKMRAKQNKQGLKKTAGKKKNNRQRQNRPQRPMGRAEAAPAAQFVERPYREPRVSRTSAKKTCMGQEEFLVDVTGTVAFTVQQSFSLNPGLAASFPWLSIEAAGWERYRFKKLDFRYTTATGSGTPGTVIMAPDYDASDSAPASQQIALAYKDREYCPPWELDKLCRLSSEGMNGAYKEHFVRTTGLSANQDVKTFDVGNLHLCTVGGTAVPWGKLFIEYEVEFYNPQIPPGGLAASASVQGSGGSFAVATPFGAAPLALGSWNPVVAGATVSLSGAPVGQEIAVTCAVTGTVITGIGFGTLVGLTLKSTVFAAFPAAATSACAYSTYVVTAPNPSFNLSVTATTVTSSTMVLAALVPAPAF